MCIKNEPENPFLILHFNENADLIEKMANKIISFWLKCVYRGLKKNKFDFRNVQIACKLC